MSEDGEGDSVAHHRRQGGGEGPPAQEGHVLLREVVETGLQAAADTREADVMKHVVRYLHTIDEDCRTFGKGEIGGGAG